VLIVFVAQDSILVFAITNFERATKGWSFDGVRITVGLWSYMLLDLFDIVYIIAYYYFNILVGL
jgi:hypothetical protein